MLVLRKRECYRRLFFGRVYGMVTKDLSRHKNSSVRGDKIRFACTKGQGLEAENEDAIFTAGYMWFS